MEIKNSIFMFMIMILVVLVYQYKYNFPEYMDKIHIDDIDISNFKTGDMILFHAKDNNNSLFMMNYYTHVGIVYVEEKTPYLFEAANTTNMNLTNDQNKRGLFLKPLIPRIKKYKGEVYFKPLAKQLDEYIIKDFKKFIDYCINNMYYEKKIFTRCVQHMLGKKCNNGTNCGELTFLSLIKLNLIDLNEYYKDRIHYLKYVSYIENLNNNKYGPIIFIIDHPF